MTTLELQEKIKLLTGEEIEEAKLELLRSLFHSQMMNDCNLDELSEKQKTELDNIFIMSARVGDLSGEGSGKVKSIKEGDTTVEFVDGGTSLSVEKTRAVLSFIARNRRLKCTVREKR